MTKEYLSDKLKNMVENIFDSKANAIINNLTKAAETEALLLQYETSMSDPDLDIPQVLDRVWQYFEGEKFHVQIIEKEMSPDVKKLASLNPHVDFTEPGSKTIKIDWSGRVS